MISPPFHPAPTPQMVKSEKKLLSSHFVQVPETPTNFHRPSTFKSTNSPKHWTPPTKLPQREWIRSGYVNHVSRTCAYSSHQVPSRSLHSKRFPRFPVSHTNSPQCHQIRLGFEIGALRNKVLLNIKFH